jgi:maleate isomerase
VPSHPSFEPHPSLDSVADSTAQALGVPPEPPVGRISVGIVTPYDFALDRELWRWLPDDVTLHLTRTRFSPLPVTVEQAEVVGDTEEVARCTTDLVAIGPDVVAYACTSGSFVAGMAGDRAIVRAIIEAGAPAAVTTSGALLEALAHVGARRIAVATPYDAAITGRLEAFLAEGGVEVVHAVHLGLAGRIWTVPYATTIQLVREAVADECDAVFVSCTNLPTYDVISPLERELGIPVLTANQVTLWSALRRAGSEAVAVPGQRLLSPSPVTAESSP